jgi:probable phosphoglycerate mutase
VTTTVFFVRHAPHVHQGRRYVARTPDIDLAERAGPILERLSQRLSAERLDAVYCSPIRRARLTAEAVAGAYGLTPQTDPAFLELDFGDWTGRDEAEMEHVAEFQAWNRSKSTTAPPGGESALDMQARMVRGVEQVRRRHGDGRIAIVSHGDPIKGAIAFYLGLSVERIAAFEVEPGSVSCMVIGDWGAKLLFLNERMA